MNDLRPIMHQFGYAWNKNPLNKNDPIMLSNVDNNSKILFSSQNRPSQKLVKRMKSLVRKYFA